MGGTMSVTQKAPLTVEILDKKGNPAPVDGVPDWMVDNSELLALTPSADGMSCEIAAVGPLGVATVTFRADADLGTGFKPIMGTSEITLTGGEATVVNITMGTPVEQE